MDDLIAQITEKTGITAAQGKDAVDSVMDWIKDKLPDSLAETVGGFMEGAGDMAAGAVEKAKEVASDPGGAASDMGEKASGLWDKAKDMLPGD